MISKASSFLIVIILFLGCTPYQPLSPNPPPTPFQALMRGGLISPGGGYASSQIGENEYEVLFAGNGFTSMERVVRFWHQKAKELCESENYTAKIEKFERNGFPSAKGTVVCK